MGEYAFDEDSRVEPGADGEYVARLTGRWDGMRGAVNGGYLLATCTRALALTMPFPDPIVISGFFLRPGTAGAATVRDVTGTRRRTTAFGEAVLTQEGKEVIRATAAFARLGQDGQVFLGGAPPDLPPPGECVRLPASGPGLPRIAERIEFRRAELPGWFRGQPTGQPSSEFWMRFADGRDADLLALPLLVDANPPPVLELGVSTTTIQLTVHLRAKPAPGWLACRAHHELRQRRLSRGRFRDLGLGRYSRRPVQAAGSDPAAVTRARFRRSPRFPRWKYGHAG